MKKQKRIMPKILISDAMDSIAEKILTSNNFDVEVKTNFTNEELIEKISLYDGLIVRSATKVTKEIIDKAKIKNYWKSWSWC